MEDRLLYRVTEVAVFLNVSRSRSSSRSPLPTFRGWTPCSSPTATTTTTASLRSLRSRTPHGRADLLRADVAAVGRTGGWVLDAGTVELRVHKSAVNRTTLDAGQMALVRSMCTSGAHGCSWRLPRPAPGNHRHAHPGHGVGDSGGQPSAWAFLAVATSEAVVSGCRLIWSPTFLACCSRRRRGLILVLEYPTDVNARPAVVPWKLRPATI